MPTPITEWRQLSHDGFARQTLMRRVVQVEAQTCGECGSVRIGRTGRRTLFEYATQSDGYGARVNPHRGLFCCKPCHDMYHGG